MKKITFGIIGLLFCLVTACADNYYQEKKFIEIRAEAGQLEARYKKTDFQDEYEPQLLAEEAFALHQKILMVSDRWLGSKHKALEVRIRTLYDKIILDHKHKRK